MNALVIALDIASTLDLHDAEALPTFAADEAVIPVHPGRKRFAMPTHGATVVHLHATNGRNRSPPGKGQCGRHVDRRRPLPRVHVGGGSSDPLQDL